MKKIILPAFFVAMASSLLFSMHNGALNMTGAPGELDCTSCHHPGPANTDPLGSMQILMPNNQGTYIPGQTYPITVQVQYPGRQKFGFSAAVRQRGIQFVQSGSLSAPTAAALQISDFATHTLPSTAGNGQKSWTFDWTAPTTASGTLVVYAASVAANGDNDATGDQVYTDSLVLSVASSLWAKDWLAPIKLYPNPATHQLFIEGEWTGAAVVDLKVYDAAGKCQLEQKINPASALPLSLGIATLASGKYWVHVQHGNKRTVTPFFKP
ncbi:MAG: hypothetical protein C0424_03145 [Sphingobacteriaceae bacterium]|nr:hypothetical protein [Sphingobacteriaceae bacterium]